MEIRMLSKTDIWQWKESGNSDLDGAKMKINENLNGEAGT